MYVFVVHDKNNCLSMIKTKCWFFYYHFPLLQSFDSLFVGFNGIDRVSKNVIGLTSYNIWKQHMACKSPSNSTTITTFRIYRSITLMCKVKLILTVKQVIILGNHEKKGSRKESVLINAIKIIISANRTD